MASVHLPTTYRKILYSLRSGAGVVPHSLRKARWNLPGAAADAPGDGLLRQGRVREQPPGLLRPSTQPAPAVRSSPGRAPWTWASCSWRRARALTPSRSSPSPRTAPTSPSRPAARGPRPLPPRPAVHRRRGPRRRRAPPEDRPQAQGPAGEGGRRGRPRPDPQRPHVAAVPAARGRWRRSRSLGSLLLGDVVGDPVGGRFGLGFPAAAGRRGVVRLRMSQPRSRRRSQGPAPVAGRPAGCCGASTGKWIGLSRYCARSGPGELASLGTMAARSSPISSASSAGLSQRVCCR